MHTNIRTHTHTQVYIIIITSKYIDSRSHKTARYRTRCGVASGIENEDAGITREEQNIVQQHHSRVRLASNGRTENAEDENMSEEAILSSTVSTVGRHLNHVQ